MSEKAKFVLGISLGLTLFILLIIGFVVLYILIKKRMKLKEKRNNENSEILNAKIKEYAKKYDFIFFNKALINLSKDRIISLKGPILISTEALVLIHPLYLEGKVHVIFSKNNELDEKFMQIKSELKNSISDKKLKETIEKLNELIKK